MGMYSEPHPNRRVVVTVRGDQRDEVVAWRCQRLPSVSCLRAVLAEHPGADAVEVWAPSFELSTSTFRHERLVRVDR